MGWRSPGGVGTEWGEERGLHRRRPELDDRVCCMRGDGRPPARMRGAIYSRKMLHSTTRSCGSGALAGRARGADDSQSITIRGAFVSRAACVTVLAGGAQLSPRDPPYSRGRGGQWGCAVFRTEWARLPILRDVGSAKQIWRAQDMAARCFAGERVVVCVERSRAPRGAVCTRRSSGISPGAPG